jgi:flagellar hook-basal body complex protein FliE
MSTPSVAANAYASLARLTDAAGAAKAADAPAGPSFGALVKDAVAALNQASRNADAHAQGMAAGKANIVDVVTAVAESEVAIDTLVSVRDRVIQSYEEIMKMPI